MTKHRTTLSRTTTALAGALASAALIAACSGGDTADPTTPGGGDEVEVSDGGGSDPSEGDDSDTEDGTGDGTEDDADGEPGDGDDGSDDGEDEAGGGDDVGSGGDGEELAAPDPLPLDGYGPGTTALVQGFAGVGETISADELSAVITEEMPDVAANCTEDLEIGAATQLECPTEVSEIAVYVTWVNLSAESSDLLVMTGEMPEEMLAEAQSEQALTVVAPLSASGDDGQVLRDDEMVDAVNAAFPGAGGAPEYEAVTCRGAIGPVDAGDEYEYTAASCAGYIQRINAATFRAVTVTSGEEAQGVLVTVSLDGQTGGD